MKKYLILLGILFITFFKSNGQDTIYALAYTGPPVFINFEDRDTANYFYIDSLQSNNIWKIGTPSKTNFTSAYSPTLALITDSVNSYPVNNTSSFTFVLLTNDLTSIDFWHRYDTDSLNDGCVVEVSSDGGLSWTNIINLSQFTLLNFYSDSSHISSNSNKSGFTGSSGWINSTILGYAFTFLRFRFTFTSDSINNNRDGWEIDNFTFQCTGTGIKDVNSNSPFHLSPNPVSDILKIQSDKQEELMTATIIDNSGKSILTTDKYNIDVSGLSPGNYFIKLKTDTKSYIHRIIRK